MNERIDEGEKRVLMNTKDAADYIGSTEGTMRTWKCIGRYSDILKPTKTWQGIRYDKANLDIFKDLPMSG